MNTITETMVACSKEDTAAPTVSRRRKRSTNPGGFWQPSFLNAWHIILVGDPVSQDNLLATLPSWGPAFRVSLDLYIHSFDEDNFMGDAGWAELLRFTTTDGQCCEIGDKLPAIMTKKEGVINIGTQLGDSASAGTNVALNISTWYRLELMQYSWKNNKVGIQQSICSK